MYRFIRWILRGIFKLFYKVKLVDFARLEKLGNKIVYLSSNLSSLDPLMLMAYLPGKPIFAMSPQTYHGWVKFFMKPADIFIIDPSNPISLKSLIDDVKKGRSVVILSEGKVSSSGLMTKVYEAPGLIAEKTGAEIVPVQINGVQYSYFSRIESTDKRPFPRVTISFLEPHKVSKSKAAREQREKIGDYIYSLMQETYYRTMIDKNLSIFALAMRAAKLFGHQGLKRNEMVEDIERKPQSYKNILVKTFALSSQFNAISKKGESIGIMLPNSIANLCTFLGLTAYDRVPAMINFSSGERNITNCCKMAQVKKIITSRKFVATLGIEKMIESLGQNKIEVFYLEDLAAKTSILAKIKALFAYKTKSVPNPKGGHRKALVLFTSGSEGMPKAVALSHYNVVSNIAQVTSMLNISTDDVWFNALPMFHSFGLTVCTLLPFMVGARLFLYPTPLHYRVIPELCYNIGATVMAATNTFLKNYAIQAHPYDFSTMRLAINGAELLREDTRNLWMEKFGIRIIVGYGATETTPVLSLNSPMYNRTGSIGQLVPGIEYKLKKVEGVAQGGELVVRGDNIMMGYMKIDNPGKIVPPKDGWYETGDIVDVDDDGYVFIKDRLKRFAKIAGEMISLSSVENLVKDTYPKAEEMEVAAVSVPHETKGEQIVLVATKPDVKIAEISEYAKRMGVGDLYVPKTFIHMETLPLLKTGKRDYPTLKTMVLNEMGIK